MLAFEELGDWMVSGGWFTTGTAIGGVRSYDCGVACLHAPIRAFRTRKFGWKAGGRVWGLGELHWCC